MTNSNENLSSSPEQQPTPPAITPEKKESKESPQLTLNIEGKCESEGQYVGLNKRQRDLLGVNEGDSVELLDAEGKSLGVFTVGKGSKAFLKEPGKFTANVDTAGSVTVRKVDKISIAEKAQTLAAEFGVEKGDSHTRRSEIISKRFPDLDEDTYLVIPGSILESLSISAGEGTIKSISKGVVRIGEKRVTMGLVPAGTSAGLTSKAQETLGIPSSATKIDFRVDPTTKELVIDQIQ
jgi:hypothetical protein